MLILMRRCGEKIFMTLASGEVITVEVTQIQGAQVRLGIDAPRNIKILRDDAKRIEERVPGDME